MIGILFFLFEFYDDQLLAFMVLILVWLCELFTLIRSLSLSLSLFHTHTHLNVHICIFACTDINIVYMFVFLCKCPDNIFLLGICLQCTHSNINEVLSSLLFALFSGFPHLFLFLCLWYGIVITICYLARLHMFHTNSLLRLFFRFFILGSLCNSCIYATSHPILLEQI